MEQIEAEKTAEGWAKGGGVRGKWGGVGDGVGRGWWGPSLSWTWDHRWDIHVYVYTYICIHVIYIHMYIYIYIVYIYVYVCMYMYACMYTHTHTHTHTVGRGGRDGTRKRGGADAVGARRTFSKVLSIVSFYSKCARPLTSQNF